MTHSESAYNKSDRGQFSIQFSSYPNYKSGFHNNYSLSMTKQTSIQFKPQFIVLYCLDTVILFTRIKVSWVQERMYPPIHMPTYHLHNNSLFSGPHIYIYTHPLMVKTHRRLQIRPGYVASGDQFSREDEDPGGHSWGLRLCWVMIWTSPPLST